MLVVATASGAGASRLSQCDEVVVDVDPGGTSTSWTVPAGEWWQVNSVAVTWVASGTAGTRALSLRYDHAATGTVDWHHRWESGSTSVTHSIVYAVGTDSSYAIPQYNLALPATYVLGPAQRLILVFTMASGDDVSKVRVNYCASTRDPALPAETVTDVSVSVPAPEVTFPDVQNVTLDESTATGLWVAIALLVLSSSFGFGLRFFRGGHE